jgi:chromosome segregation ATPase
MGRGCVCQPLTKSFVYKDGFVSSLFSGEFDAASSCSYNVAISWRVPEEGSMRLYSAEKPWGDVLPRYAFLEPVFLEKKVLEIGCGDGSGAFFLKNRGAREVVGTDQEGPGLDAARKHRKVRGVSFKPFDGQRLDSPESSFDVVVDFRLCASMDSGLLDEIRRVLKPEGYLVTLYQNPGHSSFADLFWTEEEMATSYEEFISVLQEGFSRVTVIGQTPFVGFSVGWLGAEEEDLPLEMDSVLLPEEGEEVAYYLVVCGPESLSFESQSLVQLPYRALMQEVSEVAVSVPPDEEPGEAVDGVTPTDQIHEEIREYRQAVEEKETALQEARDEMARLSKENGQLTRSVEEMDERLAVVEGEAELGRKRAEKLRELAGRHEDELAEKLSWLEAARSEVEHLQQRLQEYEKKFSTQKQRIGELEQEVLRKGKTRSDGDVLIVSLKEENAGLRIALRRLNEEIAGLREEKLHLLGERSRLEQEQQQRQSLVGGLRQEIEALNRGSERLGQQYREAQERFSLLEKDLSDLREADERLSARSQESEAEAGKLGRMLQQARKREDSLVSERQALQDELTAGQEELLQARHQLTEKTAQIAAMEARLSGQAERNQELETDLVAMVNRMEDGQYRDLDRQKMSAELQKRVEQQHEALEEAREKIDELTRELYESRKHEEGLSASLESTRASLVRQEKAREAVDLQFSSLQLDSAGRIHGLLGQMQKAESRLAAAQRDLARRTEDLQHSENAVEKLALEASHSAKEIQKVRDRLEEAEGRLRESTSAVQRVKDIEQELAWHREEVDRLRDSLQTREDELGELRWELEHVHSELENSREEFERIGRESAEALAAREALEQQAEQLRAKNRELEEKVRQAEEQRKLLENSQSELDEARKALERERSHCSLMSEELERLRMELKPTREEHELALEREQTLQARVATLQQQLGELEEKTGTELASLSDQVRRREQQMQSMTEHLAKMEEDARAADARAGRIEREATQRENSWKQRLAVLDRELEAKNAQIESLNKQKPQSAGEMEKALADREGQIGVLQRQLAGQAERINRLLTEVTDLRSKQTNK